MGVMLNPYGNRLGIANFWQETFNVYYSDNLNFKFYELLSIFKFVIDLFILNLFENTKRSKDASFLLLFVSLNLNILRFKNKRLDVFLKVFDYRMIVMVVENNYKTRNYMLLRFLRMFVRLFIFRLKKKRKLKNIKDWKLLIFYEHIHKQIINKEYKEQRVLNKNLIHETKTKELKNGFFKLLYKLRYFQKFTKLDFLKLKTLKKYMNTNDQLSMVFLKIKKKFYASLVLLKKQLFFLIKNKKNKLIILNKFKNFWFYSKFRFLFENIKKKKALKKAKHKFSRYYVKFSNLLQDLRKQSYSRNYRNLKNKKLTFNFKFYRTNFKTFFLKKRPFAFIIFQKDMLKNPINVLNAIKTNKTKIIKYTDFSKLNDPFFETLKLGYLRYSLYALRKGLFLESKLKEQASLRQKYFEFFSYSFQSFFSNSFYNKLITLYLKLQKSLEDELSTMQFSFVELKNVKPINFFFNFIQDYVTPETFVLHAFFDYDKFLFLVNQYKIILLENKEHGISKNFLFFSRLIFFLYKLQNFYEKSLQVFDKKMAKNDYYLHSHILKRYIKLKKKFKFFIKSSFFANRIKPNLKKKLALTKKNKLVKLLKEKTYWYKSKIHKNFKWLIWHKPYFTNKIEMGQASFLQYNIYLNQNKKNNNTQDQPVKDNFVTKFDYFFLKAIKKNKKMVIVRMKKCYNNFVVLTLPFLFKIMQMYKFEYLSLNCCFITSSVSAAMLARYAITRMRQGFSIGQALYGMRFGIKRSRKFAGFKFCAAGRFSRRQIATYRWIKGGSLAINTRVFGFDYAHDNYIGNFGIYGFKVWLLKAKPRINHTYG